MAHLLVLELPGANDFDILAAAKRRGHRVSFFTGDLRAYQKDAEVQRWVQAVDRIVEVNPFSDSALEKAASNVHAQDPFDGIISMVDVRLVSAAKLAESLGLRFLNSRSAALLRDKHAVRVLLAQKGIRQPDFALALSNSELRTQIEKMGLPVVVKPCDGYGSQNVAMFLNADDLNPMIDPLDHYLPCPTDYGFGVRAKDRLLVERHVSGTLIGCDAFSCDGEHWLLGVNEKVMYPAPSSAIRGGCFPSPEFDSKKVRDYLFSILDALGFDQGATHTEMVVTPDGPWLIEVNARLVGAKIPRLLSLALGRSVHEDLIDLHLGKSFSEFHFGKPKGFAASRWIAANRSGVLTGIRLPQKSGSGIREVEFLKKTGDSVSIPRENADRLGYVMTLAATRDEAEGMADDFVAEVIVETR